MFRLLEAAALTLVLGLSFMSVPGAPQASLDASWQEMLIVAHSHGMQFGKDLIFTWGPWGFLCARYHLGAEGAVAIILWQTAGQLLIALAFVALTFPLPPWRRLAFAALTLAFHWLFLDVVYFALIALIGIAGLMKRDAPVVRLVLWTLVLGFLSQIKFTYLVISCGAVGAGAACALARNSPKRALAIAVGFGASVLAAWVAAGQNPDNLYPYLRRSIDIALGYADAMGMDESWPVFIWGGALAILCSFFVWRIWRTVADRTLAFSASAFLAFVLFVMWKESYTRADMIPLGGHVFGIFTLVLILAPALPGLLFPGKGWRGFDALVPFCLVAIGSFDGDFYRLGPRVAWERIYTNLHSLARLGSLPADYQIQYDQAREAAGLPRIRAAVGRGTADVYDLNTGAAILNGLNLATRPIFQGYSAYTPSLEGYNLRFYQSDRSPEFLLWNDEGVDNRYPGQDDGPVVAGLPGHYAPLFKEGGYWLFKKVSPLSREPLPRRLLLSRRVLLGEEVELFEEQDHALWLEADAVPTNLGRLRSLAYKPAAINIATRDDHGRSALGRILPRTARSGFILVPTVASGGDLAALMGGEGRRWVRSFHFETPRGQEEFWSHVDIRLFSLPGLPLRPSLHPWLVEIGIFDRPAEAVISIAPQQIIDVHEGKALLVHAPGEIDFGVPAGATRVSFGYGIREGGYSDGGSTDGVEFSVDLRWASGRRERVWARTLEPVNSPDDRGTQHLELALPEEEGPVTLVLGAGPGPRGDNRWDWSYFSGIRFSVPGEK